MSADYGLAHLIHDLASGAISEMIIKEKLRRVRRYEFLTDSDLRHMVCAHFAAEPNVEELLKGLHSSVLKLTGLDALLVHSTEHEHSLEASTPVETR